MKIAILNNCVPFLRGGAEHLADALALKFVEYGHQALVVKIPFRWESTDSIAKSIIACRLLKLPNVDRVVALKFPAFYVPHPNRVVWLLHQFRQAYDLWGTAYQGFPDPEQARQMRELVTNSDNTYLREARTIFTNSQVTGDRLKKFNRIDSQILLPPLLSSNVFSCQEYGDYVLCLGRVNSTKRQHLIVEALKHCRTGVKVVVAGPPESESDQRLVMEAWRGDKSRFSFMSRYISDEEKIELLRRCLACAYIPYDEDSYGYVTLEACLSLKPVITCTDSGGIHTLVRNEESGFIVPPKPEALAKVMDALYSDRNRARTMGEAGHHLAAGLNISWGNVIKTLTL